jgi:tRNA (5-methylaminomethyl-2-thiouridylate)-methyltransferase
MNIAVLLSGGVDSSVVLAQLKDQGHDVTAFYLKIWLEDDMAFMGDCPWEQDLQYARAVCQQCDVSLEIISLQTEYHDRVVSYALDELKAGRTPSSDIFCNQRIKFGAFYDRINSRFDKVATGHYASIQQDGEIYRLIKGIDPVKDQTYFLSHLSQAQLSRALFPLGQYTKAQVRDLAKNYDLPTQDRKDSQGICFLGKIKYNEFVQFNLGDKPGDIVDLDSGKVLGGHKGYWFHTIGQRQGLGLSGGPWYVAQKDVDQNIVYVVHGEQLLQQARSEFNVGQLHWIADPPRQTRLQLKLRHGPAMIHCEVQSQPQDQWTVTLDEPDTGIAPGQFAVFYEEKECLGAGTIL